MIITTNINTPLGTMLAGATDEGICLFEYEHRKMIDAIQKRICNGLNTAMQKGDHVHFKILRTQIDEYFNGSRTIFNIPLHLVGSEFQKRVWNALLQIPFGETRSYKQQSLLLGNEKAIRAVAGANGDNGIAIIVPCHRVIGENGSLTGYGGGLWRKKWLLQHETKYSGKASQLSFFEEMKP
jgi:AraC family transcriptional regulator of adaptative response/methylated-DNA-[protein]-cysteine methyltransferase